MFGALFDFLSWSAVNTANDCITNAKDAKSRKREIIKIKEQNSFEIKYLLGSNLAPDKEKGAILAKDFKTVEFLPISKLKKFDRERLYLDIHYGMKKAKPLFTFDDERKYKLTNLVSELNSDCYVIFKEFSSSSFNKIIHVLICPRDR